jgi:hypothetical protein
MPACQKRKPDGASLGKPSTSRVAIAQVIVLEGLSEACSACRAVRRTIMSHRNRQWSLWLLQIHVDEVARECQDILALQKYSCEVLISNGFRETGLAGVIKAPC